MLDHGIESSTYRQISKRGGLARLRTVPLADPVIVGDGQLRRTAAQTHIAESAIGTGKFVEALKAKKLPELGGSLDIAGVRDWEGPGNHTR